MRKPPPNRRALPLAEWPAIDRMRWADALQEGDDLLDTPRAAARWRASSREQHMRCYGLWLAWLRTEGLLDMSSVPESRVTSERVMSYLRAARDLGAGPRTLLNHAVGLRHMFEALAPDQDWQWMLTGIEKLKAAVKPRKNHSGLPPIRLLFELGLRVMRHADRSEDATLKQRAILHRNGLAIAMLAARPMMRRNNVSTIRVGQHLVREGSVYRLKFSGDEMKGGRALGGPLPVILTSHVERHMAAYRPVLLLGKPDDATLFISAMGNPITPHNFSDEIGQVCEAAFGRRVTMHAFRHAAGSSIAKEDPEHVGIVQTVLGHSDLRTSLGYYVHADEYAAFKNLDRALDRIMNGEL